MSRTKIEWCDYTINPIKGLCPMACSYCYARAMSKRFKWNTEIRFNPRWWADVDSRKPRRYFVGSTMELFGEWIPDEWIENILYRARLMDAHIFIFLTKQPQNLRKWSPFPDNCWVGVSATNAETTYTAMDELSKVNATVKFISFEPLLSQINGGECEGERLDGLKYAGINWVIIGRQTPASKKTEPKVEWIKEIVEAADKAHVPVFLKDNLFPLLEGHNEDPWVENPWAFTEIGHNSFDYMYGLRQEFPR